MSDGTFSKSEIYAFPSGHFVALTGSCQSKRKGRFVRLPRCRRALVWLVSFLFVFNTIPTGVFADEIVNNDPQQNTTSENLSNESADSASVSGGVRTSLRLTIRRFQVMIINLNLMSRISSQTM